jgi:hypothetical protein
LSFGDRETDCPRMNGNGTLLRTLRTFTPPLNSVQQKALAIVPKCTAVPSILGSLFIIKHALHKKRRNRVYHRLVWAMSSMDLIWSIKAFMSTWPVPAPTNIYGARGTTESCAVWGAIGQGASLASILYNASLTLFFLLTVRYGWSERRSRQIEVWLHLLPLLIGWSTAITGLPLTLYNSIGWTCWIGPWPLNCQDTRRFGETTCLRGDNAWIYRWVFFHAWNWLVVLFVMTSLCMIYKSVSQQESRTDKYRMGRDSPRRKKQSRAFATQAILYVAVFVLTWIFPMVLFAIQQHSGTTYTPLLFLIVIFSPLQGFFDFFVYIRPSYEVYRKAHPDQTLRQVLQQVLGVHHILGWEHSSSDIGNVRQLSDNVNIQLPAETAKICKISGEERANGALALNGAAEHGVSVSLGKPPANEMASEREEETGDYLE